MGSALVVLEEPSGGVDKGKPPAVGVTHDLFFQIIGFVGVLQNGDPENADGGEASLGYQFGTNAKGGSQDFLVGYHKGGIGLSSKDQDKVGGSRHSIRAPAAPKEEQLGFVCCVALALSS